MIGERLSPIRKRNRGDTLRPRPIATAGEAVILVAEMFPTFEDEGGKTRILHSMNGRSRSP